MFDFFFFNHLNVRKRCRCNAEHNINYMFLLFVCYINASKILSIIFQSEQHFPVFAVYSFLRGRIRSKLVVINMILCWRLCVS